MSQYQRCRVPGGSYFFTVVSEQRQCLLTDHRVRNELRRAIAHVRARHPFQIDALILLPDHLHCVWTLPQADADYSLRWRLIKTRVTKALKSYPKIQPRSNSLRSRKQYGNLWQHRFWEHYLRDEKDFMHHIHYVHWNPVKHGLVEAPEQWPYSAYHSWKAQQEMNP